MKTRFLIIIMISSSLIFLLLNYHIEYHDQESVYVFCEEFLFSGKKTMYSDWRIILENEK